MLVEHCQWRSPWILWGHRHPERCKLANAHRDICTQTKYSCPVLCCFFLFFIFFVNHSEKIYFRNKKKESCFIASLQECTHQKLINYSQYKASYNLYQQSFQQKTFHCFVCIHVSFKVANLKCQVVKMSASTTKLLVHLMTCLFNVCVTYMTCGCMMILFFRSKMLEIDFHKWKLTFNVLIDYTIHMWVNYLRWLQENMLNLT